MVFFFFSGCKKDKLKSDKEYLIGTWKWHHSTIIYQSCDGSLYSEETITPGTTNMNYKIEFRKKGYAIFYKNEEKIEKKRIVFSSFTYTPAKPGYWYSFYIDLDNDGNKSIYGYLEPDTLLLNGSYFPFENENCKYYLSYFIKE